VLFSDQVYLSRRRREGRFWFARRLFARAGGYGQQHDQGDGKRKGFYVFHKFTGFLISVKGLYPILFHISTLKTLAKLSMTKRRRFLDVHP
jgi:hypothetical protein